MRGLESHSRHRASGQEVRQGRVIRTFYSDELETGTCERLRLSLRDRRGVARVSQKIHDIGRQYNCSGTAREIREVRDVGERSDDERVQRRRRKLLANGSVSPVKRWAGRV